MKKTYIEKVSHNTQARPFSIHYTDVHPNAKLALYLHCHPEMELYYLEDGELDFYVEDTVFRLKKGQAIFVPPGLLHHAERLYNNDKSDHCSFYAVVFSREMLLMDELPPYCERYFTPVFVKPYECIVKFSESEMWQNHVINMLREIISMNEISIRESELAIRGLLMMIWQDMYNNHFSKVYETPSYKTYNMLIKCTDYIKDHYTDAVSLSDLARLTGMSEGHFCRVFKDFTGFTPFAYINRLRISKSLELLTDTDKKIAEIATICGFNNVSYYNRTFYKMMQESPSNYRKHFF